MTFHYDCLCIEVTRRCNMACPHCLRGDAQDNDINLDYIDKMLEDVKHISTILFTGGEPSLNTNAIEHTLQYCKDHNIIVDSFYIVTNGKEVTPDFIRTLVNWYLYCAPNDYDNMSGVALSKDMYHENIDPTNETLLRCFSFFKEDKFVNWNETPALEEGRAKDYLPTATRPIHDQTKLYVSYDETDDTYYVSDNDITLTVNGDIMPQCDYAYDRCEDIRIGTIHNMAQYYRQLHAAAEIGAAVTWEYVAPSSI